MGEESSKIKAISKYFTSISITFFIGATIFWAIIMHDIAFIKDRDYLYFKQVGENYDFEYNGYFYSFYLGGILKFLFTFIYTQCVVQIPLWFVYGLIRLISCWQQKKFKK